jgi:hypothetical protein
MGLRPAVRRREHDVIIDVSDGEVRVREPDDLRRLNVADGSSSGNAAQILAAAGWGTSADDSPGVVWLDIARLHAAAESAPGERPDEWDAAWTSMIAFAAEFGWVRGDSHVRAHIDAAI